MNASQCPSDMRCPVDFVKRRTGHSNVFVSVDDYARIDNPDSEYHLVCATSVNDVNAFEEAVEPFDGLGFRKAVRYRRQVLGKIDPVIGRIYYILVRKSGKDYTAEEMQRIHRHALRMLADMVMATECGYYVDVEIADDPLIKEIDAESVFRTCRHSVGRSVDANCVGMDESFGLQANTFVTGAVALMHVRDDNRFIDSLKSSMYGFFTNTEDLEKWTQSDWRCPP